MSPAAYGVKPVLEGKVNSLPFAILPSVLSFLLSCSIVFERVDAIHLSKSQNKKTSVHIELVSLPFYSI